MRTIVKVYCTTASNPSCVDFGVPTFGAVNGSLHVVAMKIEDLTYIEEKMFAAGHDAVDS